MNAGSAETLRQLLRFALREQIAWSHVYVFRVGQPTFFINRVSVVVREDLSSATECGAPDEVSSSVSALFNFFICSYGLLGLDTVLPARGPVQLGPAARCMLCVVRPLLWSSCAIFFLGFPSPLVAPSSCAAHIHSVDCSSSLVRIVEELECM